MPVITADTTVKGVRREEAFEWLSEPANHGRILEGLGESLEARGEGSWLLTLKLPWRRYGLEYRFSHTDRSHGGRRVRIETGGRRTRGFLEYSLRTNRPSPDTLLTVHLDYDPGAVLGLLADHLALRKQLDRLCKDIAERTRQLLESELAGESR